MLNSDREYGPRTLELDSETDARLSEIAAERNQDVSAVLAEAVALLDSTADLEFPDVQEDRRRYEEYLKTGLGVPREEVKVWMASWAPAMNCRRRQHESCDDPYNRCCGCGSRTRKELSGWPNPQAATQALAVIRSAIDQLDAFPHLGNPTNDPGIRQVFTRFGKSGYLIRYVTDFTTKTMTITRIWHAREARL